jgi:DNA polymerase III epsilon subunit-like protein
MKPITPPVISAPMFVFLDFEASSLAKLSYPIEVAWVFEDGAHESHLIRPAPQWTDWDAEAQAVHHIPREMLEQDGSPHDVVARRMVEQLSGHMLFASAPSWDGKWLSALLRAAKLPRHALRVRDTEEARAEVARRILAPVVPADRLHIEIDDLLTLVEVRREEGEPAHRALADAQDEHRHWLEVVAAAEAVARRASGG